MNTTAQLVHFQSLPDARGLLGVGEVGAHLPFTPVRFFAIRDVPPDAARGSHAHRQCEQLVIVLSGSCRLTLIDAQGRDELTLDSPLQGLYVPPMVWLEQSAFTAGTVVLVLASHGYDASDYIRSMAEFREAIAGT